MLDISVAIIPPRPTTKVTVFASIGLINMPIIEWDHPYSRTNDYKEQLVNIIARAVIEATIRISANFTVLHLTSKHN